MISKSGKEYVKALYLHPAYLNYMQSTSFSVLQNRKRDTDVQNRLLDSVGEGEGGMFQENSMYIIYSETDH